MISNPRGYKDRRGEFENMAFDPGLVVDVNTSIGVGRLRAEAELLDLATEAFGTQAQAWLKKPHDLFGGQSPAEFAAAGGLERVRMVLRAIQHGGIV